MLLLCDFVDSLSLLDVFVADVVFGLVGECVGLKCGFLRGFLSSVFLSKSQNKIKIER